MTNQVRLAGLLGFLLGMPVLAIPAVNGGIERWWYGPDEPLAHAEVRSEVESSTDAGRDSARDARATSDRKADERAAAERETTERENTGLEAAERQAAPPPPLSRLPDTDSAGSGAPQPGIDRRTVEPAQGPPVPRVADAFSDLQQRLREIGGTAWRMEVSPDHEDLVRFTCQVPLPGHDSYQRTFMAEAREPIEAMTQAIGQIEQWRKAHTERPAILTESTTGNDRGNHRPVDRVRMIRRPPAATPNQ